MSTDSGAWQRVKALFGQVSMLPVESRSAFLDKECGADNGLRCEVESLLSAGDAADNFLERPAAQVFEAVFASGLLQGRNIGPYRVETRLGAGGMGEVYRALDTRLGRTVAIKVLSAELAADPQGRRRFEREARAVAALSHPHICTLYDVGAHDGINFLVMEFLQARRWPRG